MRIKFSEFVSNRWEEALYRIFGNKSENIMILEDTLCFRTFVKMFLSIFCFVRPGDRAQSNVGGTYMEPNYALWSWSTIGTKKRSLLEHNSD